MVLLTRSESVRRPAVAGSFYPGDPGVLREQVATAVAAASPTAGPALAAIAPHAGYVYSGATAARAVASLGGEAADRVIVLGPAHTMAFSGAALPRRNIRAFATPIGEVPLDLDALAALATLPGFAGPYQAHDDEHCLEVELPFLQVVMEATPIVPVLIGGSTAAEDAVQLAFRLGELVGPRTRVLVSTDFTHHGRPYGFSPFPQDGRLGERLIRLARATAERAAAIDPRGFFHQVEVSGDSVCGARPVLVLLELLHHAFEGRGDVLDVTTSADVSRNWNQVVSYAAVAFRGQWRQWRDPAPPQALPSLTPADGRLLTTLARAVLATLLRHDESLAAWFAAQPVPGWMMSEAGVFVSLHRRPGGAAGDGRLRGCIGTIEASRPLLDAVVQNACAAARDPRFAPLSEAELDQVEVEVSVMSPLRLVTDPDEITLGLHGVVISSHGRRGLFLPQVARQLGWDRERFLSQLAVKAGLPEDAWRSGARLEIFTAAIFSESTS